MQGAKNWKQIFWVYFVGPEPASSTEVISSQNQSLTNILVDGKEKIFKRPTTFSLGFLTNSVDLQFLNVKEYLIVKEYHHGDFQNYTL